MSIKRDKRGIEKKEKENKKEGERDKNRIVTKREIYATHSE